MNAPTSPPWVEIREHASPHGDSGGGFRRVPGNVLRGKATHPGSFYSDKKCRIRDLILHRPPFVEKTEHVSTKNKKISQQGRERGSGVKDKAPLVWC